MNNEINSCNKLCEKFQEEVNKSLVRHQSILDVISKFQETNARTNRAIVKAITNCGCVQVQAKKQEIPEETNFSDLQNYMTNHLQGQLCESCQEIIETELGKMMFYAAALCENLGLDFKDVLNKELDRVKTLGIFNLR